MGNTNQPVLETDTLESLVTLETLKKEMKDPDYEPVVDKAIAATKALLAAGNVAEAAQKSSEAKILIEQATASNKAAPHVWELFWLELGYLLLLLAGGYAAHLLSAFQSLAVTTKDPLQAAWFGALGGVTIGLFGLYSHVQARDFDSKFTLWYVCKPIMGGIFGWFVFMVFYVGLIAVGTQTANANPLLLYLVAFLAGFSERFTIKIVDRVMQVLMTWEDKPQNSTGAAQTL